MREEEKPIIYRHDRAEKIKLLSYAFGMGMTVTDACIHAGIGLRTYYDWCEDDEKLAHTFAQQREKQALKARALIDKALDDGDLNTAKWYLERKKSAEFSVTVNQDVDMKAKVVTEVRKTVVSPKKQKNKSDNKQ